MHTAIKIPNIQYTLQLRTKPNFHKTSGSMPVTSLGHLGWPRFF